MSPSGPTASDAGSRAASPAGLVRARERPVGEVQETERRKDGDRLAELEVIRRPSSPQRRIVHRRQVVEDQ